MSKISRNEKTFYTFLDLSKASVTVNYGILLKKIEADGARGSVLQLLSSFFQKRRQFVQVDERNSEDRDLKVGLPQGSILGPM